MRYVDVLYGPVDIDEPVLLDLMASDALDRLRGVTQHGVTALLGITPPFTRFDHSVGAMLLVRRLGASLEEQIGALLHDVSHTAFSHVFDFVFDDHSSQSYHEEKKPDFLGASDVPDILRRHGRDWRDFIDETRFSLLEQDMPALCADRLDYFLRDLEFLDLATGADIRAALEALAVRDGRIVVADADTARWLAYTFIEVDRASWSSVREVGLYQLAAEAIKAAVRTGAVSETDYWGSDETLWSRLRAAEHPEVRQWLELLCPGTRFVADSAHPHFRVSPKVRSIDPPVLANGIVSPLSALDPAFAAYRAGYLAAKRGELAMAVVGAPVADIEPRIG